MYKLIAADPDLQECLQGNTFATPCAAVQWLAEGRDVIAPLGLNYDQAVAYIAAEDYPCTLVVA